MSVSTTILEYVDSIRSAISSLYMYCKVSLSTSFIATLCHIHILLLLICVYKQSDCCIACMDLVYMDVMKPGKV